MPQLCFLEQSCAWVAPILKVLNSSPEWGVVAQSNRWNAELLKRLAHKPDVYLIGFDSVDTQGLGLMRKVFRHDHRAVVMALIPNDKSMVMACLQEGAHGICFREEILSELMSGLNSIHRGQYHLSPESTRLTIEQCISTDPRESVAVKKMASAELTPRELKVLGAMRKGHPAKRVAHELGISIYTVNQHLRSIYRKMNVHNRIEAVHLAHLSGLI